LNPGRSARSLVSILTAQPRLCNGVIAKNIYLRHKYNILFYSKILMNEPMRASFQPFLFLRITF